MRRTRLLTAVAATVTAAFAWYCLLARARISVPVAMCIPLPQKAVICVNIFVRQLCICKWLLPPWCI